MANKKNSQNEHDDAPAKKTKASSVKKKRATKKSNARPKATLKNKKTDDVLRLDAVLVINDAQKIHSQLDALLKEKHDVIIDASAVEIVDTAILQILLVFSNQLKGMGSKIKWLKLSNEFMLRVSLLDLGSSLGIPEKAGNAS